MKYTASDLVHAAKEGNKALISSALNGNGSAQLLTDLSNLEDDTGNIFHHLLASSSWLKIRKRRKAKAEICYQLLGHLQSPALLDQEDSNGETPLHLAIKAGNQVLVKRMLEVGANFSKLTKKGLTALDVAAIHQKQSIYKDLLDLHSAEIEKSEEPVGFTDAQIQSAHNTYQRNLRVKQISMGVFASLMTIACPVGAVLAFYELPLLELVFSVFIPGIGPFIGLAGACVFGALLFFSVYHKVSMKYGSYAQELARLEATSAQLDRLETELRKIDKQLSSSNGPSTSRTNLQDARKEIVNRLQTIYDSLEVPEFRVEASDASWASTTDRIRTTTLTLGSFVCAFSGLIGVLGGLTPFLPPVLMAGAAFAGVPIFGWCAFGVALAIGVGVAVWAYKTKYKPALEEAGQARQTLHEKKMNLNERRKDYEKSLRPFNLSSNLLQKDEAGSQFLKNTFRNEGNYSSYFTETSKPRPRSMIFFGSAPASARSEEEGQGRALRRSASYASAPFIPDRDSELGFAEPSRG
jgi:hypothetical protein